LSDHLFYNQKNKPMVVGITLATFFIFTFPVFPDPLIVKKIIFVDN
jgi:hypothetical protein